MHLVLQGCSFIVQLENVPGTLPEPLSEVARKSRVGFGGGGGQGELSFSILKWEFLRSGYPRVSKGFGELSLCGLWADKAVLLEVGQSKSQFSV